MAAVLPSNSSHQNSFETISDDPKKWAEDRKALVRGIQIASESKSEASVYADARGPRCSSCREGTILVEGATCVENCDKQGKSPRKRPQLELWECVCCNNYEATGNSMLSRLRSRLFARTKGSFIVEVERMPTFTRHGRLQLSKGLKTFTCFIPVKAMRSQSKTRISSR